MRTCVYAARDHLGVKPLYVGRHGDALYFASEIKAFPEHVKEFREVPAGHFFTPETGMQTFSASFEGKGEDRLAARKVAEFLGTDHHDFAFSPEEALAVLPEVIYHFESFDPEMVKSSTAQYLLSQVVSEEVKTALVGEGADELFCDYDHYKRLMRERGPAALRQALVDDTCNLQRGVLRRVDRTSMAHRLELRPPFLDVRLVEYAHRIPVNYRLPAHDGWEKWILRKASDGYLAEEILWRRKNPFAKGAGARDPLREMAEAEVTDADFERERNEVSPPIRSKDELHYYRIFREHFGTDTALRTVFRWALDDDSDAHIPPTRRRAGTRRA